MTEVKKITMLSLQNLALTAQSVAINTIESRDFEVIEVENKSEISFTKILIQGTTFNFAYYKKAEIFRTINVYEDITEIDCLRFKLHLEKDSKAALILKLRMEEWTEQNKRADIERKREELHNLELELDLAL